MYSAPYQVALALHLLATVVWVGGMFFAHMALRPAAQALLEPPQRLPLLHRVLGHFFPWVWLAFSLLLITGFWLFLGHFGGKVALWVHVMSGIGLVMVGIFLYITFVPYRRMGTALAAGDLPAAGAAMARVRGLILVNLCLGLIEVLLGGLRPVL